MKAATLVKKINLKGFKTDVYEDILTDEASVISGSMGLMPSASMGADIALYFSK